MSIDQKTYWEFYGLNADPFVHAADPQEIYLPSRWEQLFDLLNHLCHKTNMIIALTAVHGVGKTTFINQFISQSSETVRICQFSDVANLLASQLLSCMSQSFSLPHLSGGTLDEQLDSHLGNIQHCEHLCLLIIDNAQDLSQENLKILFYLIRHQSDAQMRLHIILVGLPELKHNLQQLTQEEGESELINSIEFSAFTLQETAAYLNDSLLKAGLPAASPCTSAVIKKIDKLAGGLPKEINRVAAQVLSETMQTKKFKGFADFFHLYKNQVIGGFILLPILFLGMVVFTSASNYQKPSSVILLSAPKKLAMKHEIITKPKQLVPLQTDKIINPIPSSVSIMTPSIIQPPKLLDNAQLVTNTKPKQVLKPLKPANKVVAKAKPRPLSIQKLSKTSAGYTLQLIGLSNERAMRTFIANNSLRQFAGFYRSKLNGKDWFVVLYGQYATPEAAKTAIAQLPPTVRGQKPWVRKLANVQYPIEKA